MIIHIKNEHLSTTYPLVAMMVADKGGINYNDRETGREYCAVDISGLEELTTLLSLAKATNEYCTGLYFDGTSLVLSEKPYTLGE